MIKHKLTLFCWVIQSHLNYLKGSFTFKGITFFLGIFPEYRPE